MAGKTHNHSVRFDAVHLKFFKDDNPGIKKPQQVVDTLLHRYFKEHNTVSKAIEPAGTPVPVKTADFVEDFKPGPPAVSKYDSFIKEIKAAPSVKHVEAVAFLIKADKDLSPAQKQKLEMEAREHSKTFDF